MHSNPLIQVLVYLGAMLVSVPIAKRLGLGAVLGYLIAGALLGPHVLGWIADSTQDASHLSEFGVIMMLFLIGLELKPSLLWKMRGPIFGLGSLQVVGVTAAFAAVGVLTGTEFNTSLAVGLVLASSSTAIVLQTLQEKGLLKTTGGDASFSVLLFQDIAVIPILALLPLLGEAGAREASGPAWLGALKVLGAVGAVIAAGRFLIRPAFRMIAAAHLRELFTAMALFLVLAITALMNAVDLSPALGAFLAGVVLADSEYRHQLETDIQPFKGLLLGVFFISVGAQIDFVLVTRQPSWILMAVLGIVAIKGVVHVIIGTAWKLPKPDRWLFTLALAQGGEFAFVLISYARGYSLWNPEVGQLMTASVALSMAFAPPLITAYVRLIQPRYLRGTTEEREADVVDERENPVIIAGVGRFGQTVARLLKSSGFRVTVLDADAEQIEVIRRFGLKAFYGDASRMDILEAAGIAHAKVMILAIDDHEKTLEIAAEIRKHYPRLPVLARAYDRIHAYKLLNLGVSQIAIETSGSALALGTEALRHLGMAQHQATRTAQIFRRHNDQSIQALSKVYNESDESTFMSHARSWLDALEKLFQTDAKDDFSHEIGRGWESPPRAHKELPPDVQAGA